MDSKLKMEKFIEVILKESLLSPNHMRSLLSEDLKDPIGMLLLGERKTFLRFSAILPEGDSWVKGMEQRILMYHYIRLILYYPQIYFYFNRCIKETRRGRKEWYEAKIIFYCLQHTL